MKEIETTIKSLRNAEIPVSIIDCQKENAGLILFIHGFKANRHEDGRFTQVGLNLAKEGFSSIRMSFAGCQGSDEDFINYTLNNCLKDIDASYQYMLNHYSINPEKIGMVGYSMGGRLTSIYIQKHPEVKSIALWAGACYDGFEDGKFLGGNAAEMKKEAEEKGYCYFLNSFDNSMLKLNKELIDDFENLVPSKGFENYEGSVLIVHGSADVTVLPKTVDMVLSHLHKVKEKEVLIIEGANHGFGAWDNHPEQSDLLVNRTTQFLMKTL